MTDIRLERVFSVSPERLFNAVTKQSDLLEWWGPEGMHVPEHDLDFSRLGPWFSVMVNSEGQRYKVSGQVTSFDPHNSVGFTWAWHDYDDRRGAESHVTFTILSQEGGSRLIIDHCDLADGESGQNHTIGWTSSLNKLLELLN